MACLDRENTILPYAESAGELLLGQPKIESYVAPPVRLSILFVVGRVGNGFPEWIHPVSVSPCLGEIVPGTRAVQNSIVDLQYVYFETWLVDPPLRR